MGREIHYVPISTEDFAAAAAEQGIPSEVVEGLTFLFGEVLDGRNARHAAATGIWSPRAEGGRHGEKHNDDLTPNRHALGSFGS